MKKNLLGLSLGAACLVSALGVFAVGADSPAKAAGSSPTALKAQLKADGVYLSWAGPVDIYNTQRITESFETYELNAEQFGAWGNEDIDGIDLTANRVNLTVGKNAPAGWYVTAGSGSYRVPSEGEQMIAVSGVTGTADDWLISPLLADVENQYISFSHKKTNGSYTETGQPHQNSAGYN